MEQLAQKHTNERTACTKSQDRELENLKAQFDKDLEKLRQQQKTDMDKRFKFEANEEKKFLRGLKDKQDHEMKQFMSQQRVDYRATKSLYKRVSHFFLEHYSTKIAHYYYYIGYFCYMLIKWY